MDEGRDAGVGEGPAADPGRGGGARRARVTELAAELAVSVIEVLPPGHPLWTDDNVPITPHLAGSQGNELRRLAELAVAEVTRWAAGQAFAHPVRRERLGMIA